MERCIRNLLRYLFNEMVADVVISRWQIVDEVTKVLVALTASGSAVAGWTLWNDPDFKEIWVVIAGTTAFLAIIHSALLVPSKIKSWGDIQRRLCSLRIDLDSLRNKMKIDSNFSIPDISEKLDQLREEYRDASQNMPNDILITDKLQLSVQDKLNRRMADQIIDR